jgi:hypothetical protein
MYKVIRQTEKTCFAFKILAAGRIGEDIVAQASARHSQASNQTTVCMWVCSRERKMK